MPYAEQKPRSGGCLLAPGDSRGLVKRKCLQRREALHMPDQLRHSIESAAPHGAEGFCNSTNPRLSPGSMRQPPPPRLKDKLHHASTACGPRRL
jgi:hypothetical protein